MTEYVAPFTRLLTVVHLRDDSAEVPATRCGQPMAEHEFWLPVSLEGCCGIVCQQCETGVVPEQGTLL